MTDYKKISEEIQEKHSESFNALHISELKDEIERLKEKCDKQAMIIRRIYPENFPDTWFVAGAIGEVDKNGLPKMIEICPAYGCDWTQIYERTDHIHRRNGIIEDSFVYKWTDILTGKKYIGVHKGTADDGYVCSSKYMMNEYQKRPDDFIREVLEYGTYRDCLNKETLLLKEDNASSNTQYYNQSNGSESFFHVGPHTSETKRKISVTKTGKPLSEEHKQKISKSSKGKPKSEKTREKMRLNAVGRPAPNEGKKHSEETINKIREKATGRKHTPETKEKLRQLIKGRR